GAFASSALRRAISLPRALAQCSRSSESRTQCKYADNTRLGSSPFLSSAPGTILLYRGRDGDYSPPRHFPYFAILTNGRLLSAEPKKYEKRQGITTCRLETYHLRHAKAPPRHVSRIAYCPVVLGSMDGVWGWDWQIRPHVGN